MFYFLFSLQSSAKCHYMYGIFPTFKHAKLVFFCEPSKFRGIKVTFITFADSQIKQIHNAQRIIGLAAGRRHQRLIVQKARTFRAVRLVPCCPSCPISAVLSDSLPSQLSSLIFTSRGFASQKHPAIHCHDYAEKNKPHVQFANMGLALSIFSYLFLSFLIFSFAGRII